MQTETQTFSTLIMLAIGGGFLHTIAEPAHYLPFIAIAKSKKWSLFHLIRITALCGIGHMLSALGIATLFFITRELLTEANLHIIEDYRGMITAWVLLCMGLLYALWGGWAAMRYTEPCCHHQHNLEHKINHMDITQKTTILMLMLIFILDPCEALLPILTSAATLNTYALILIAVIFSATTILTMISAAICGFYGLRWIESPFIERYAHLISGVIIAICGALLLIFSH